jgi:hypothetical protein
MKMSKKMKKMVSRVVLSAAKARALLEGKQKPPATGKEQTLWAKGMSRAKMEPGSMWWHNEGS